MQTSTVRIRKILLLFGILWLWPMTVWTAASDEMSVDEEYLTYIEGNFDLSADPCTNFYNYACGNWYTNNFLLYKYVLINMYHLIELTYEERLINMLIHLSNNIPPRNMDLYKLVLNAWEVCESTNAVFMTNGLNVPRVLDVLWTQMITPGLPFNWLRVLATLRTYGFSGVLFNVHVVYAEEESSANYIVIDAFQDYSAVNFFMLNAYFDLSGQVLIGRESLIADILIFQAELANLNKVDSAETLLDSSYLSKEEAPRPVAEPISLQELAHLFPEIDWPFFFGIVFNQSDFRSEELRNLSIKVNIQNPHYFLHLQNLIAHTNPNTIIFYLKYQFQKYFESTLSEELPKHCISYIDEYFPMMLNFLYEKFIFQDEYPKLKTIFDNLFSGVKASYAKSFETNKLNLTIVERDYLNNKLKKLKLIMGSLPANYTEAKLKAYYKNIELSRKHDFHTNHLKLIQFKEGMNLKRVLNPVYHNLMTFVDFTKFLKRPSYAGGSNIFIPYTYMQKPVFHPELSAPIIDSLWSAILVFEIYFAFSSLTIHLDENSQYSPIGEKIQEKMANFHPKNSPLIYTLTEVLTGQTVLYEASQYYFSRPVPHKDHYLHKWLAEHNITYEQFFYINSAQYTCGNTNIRNWLITVSMPDDDQPDEWIVQEHWQKSKELAKAFHCTPPILEIK